MNLLKLAGISLLMIFLTGCYNPGKDTPENLLNELPVYDVEEQNIYKDVERVLGGAELILPSNSKTVGKINKIDLDNSGKQEIVFFQRRETLNEKDITVGFTVLDTNNDESYDTTYTKRGSNIKYANFYDLDNDGKKEIILLIEDEEKVTLDISRYNNGKIENIISEDNFDLSEGGKYLDLNILIYDMDNDNIRELLLYNYDQENRNMNIYVANLKNNKIEIKDTMTFEDIKNSEGIKAQIGNITSKKKGLFLSLLDNKSNRYITKVIYMSGDKLVEALGNSKEVSNMYYIPFADINNDGITNIPVVKSVSNDNLDENTLKSNATISWYKYDINSENQKKLFVIQIYYNYEYDFKFFIPNRLVDRLYINEEFNGNSKVFKFSYYDLKKEKPKDLFTLTLIEKNIADSTENMSKTNNNVLESSRYILSISNTNEKELEKLDLNTDIISDYFSQIND